ncbi:MAG: translation initiation factor IF-2 N-terminal domain-containing protein, partial [Thermoanaerobaculia bacterium]|nr:translation initiation factor IF-2 N-terminal domain-containing protein [Thermoanaerobaculia bacterium]
MAKIPVQDLARKMGLAEQDLVFKLRSLGVRIEGDDGVDAEALQAIMQGKRLASPREVFMDDTVQAPPPPAAQPAAPVRRATANPLKATRRRAIIQSVEPRILNLPSTPVERTPEAETPAPA